MSLRQALSINERARVGKPRHRPRALESDGHHSQTSDHGRNYPKTLRRAASCTWRAAVILPVLDRKFPSGTDYRAVSKNSCEVFHTAKNFVLLCRSVPAY